MQVAFIDTRGKTFTAWVWTRCSDCLRYNNPFLNPTSPSTSTPSFLPSFLPFFLPCPISPNSSHYVTPARSQPSPFSVFSFFLYSRFQFKLTSPTPSRPFQRPSRPLPNSSPSLPIPNLTSAEKLSKEEPIKISSGASILRRLRLRRHGSRIT